MAQEIETDKPAIAAVAAVPGLKRIQLEYIGTDEITITGDGIATVESQVNTEIQAIKDAAKTVMAGYTLASGKPAKLKVSIIFETESADLT